MQWTHQRMPVIVEPTQVHDWLLALPARAAAVPLASPPQLDSFPVDLAYNSTRHDRPIAPYAAPDQPT